MRRTKSPFDAQIVSCEVQTEGLDPFGAVIDSTLVITALVKEVYFVGSKHAPLYDDPELELIVDIQDENDLIGTGYLDDLESSSLASTCGNRSQEQLSMFRRRNARSDTQGQCFAAWICERRDENADDSRSIVYFLLVIPSSPPSTWRRIGIGHTQDLLTNQIYGCGAFYNCEPIQMRLL